jgi:tetratricopeptide (TPR) repeat protein
VMLVSAGSTLTTASRFAEAEFCFRKALARDPDFATARVALTRFIVDSLLAERCIDRDACTKEVTAQARTLRREPARILESVTLEVAALRDERRFLEAERLLAEYCPKLEGRQRADCLGEEFRTVLANPERSHERLASLVRAYAVALCANGDCSAELRTAAETLISAGEREEAVTLLERAATDEPSFPTLLALADAAIATENWSRARSALARATRLADNHPDGSRQIQDRMRIVVDHVAHDGTLSSP